VRALLNPYVIPVRERFQLLYVPRVSAGRQLDYATSVSCLRGKYGKAKMAVTYLKLGRSAQARTDDDRKVRATVERILGDIEATICWVRRSMDAIRRPSC
jgi:hypothetical protein